MTLFSFKALALAWTGLAGVAAVGAGVLQASYVPPVPVAVAPQPASFAPVPPVAAPVMQAAVPFENRSLLAVLPPPHPAVAPLPVPPIPPVRVAHAETHRMAPARTYGTEPAYAAEAPWGWERRPYPGQYASGQAPYYAGQPYGYGWPPQD